MKSPVPAALASLILPLLCTGAQISPAEDLPTSPSATWRPNNTSTYQLDLKSSPRKYPHTDPNKVYALYELIDIAEEQNPATRVSWNRLKQAAANLGVAKSALYPTLALNVPAIQERAFLVFPNVLLPILKADSERMDVTTVNPVLRLNYLIFDFGERRGAIDAAHANLFVSGTALNDTHERIALQVTTSYYGVLSAKGLVDAARASLKDAEASERSVQDRLNQGLATLPNLLNAKAQLQQATYTLENSTGTEEIATSKLAQSVGLDPTSTLKIKNMTDAPERSELEDSVEQLIDHALIQRPDLLEQVGQIRVADAEIKEARSALYPTVKAQAQGGYDSMRTVTNAGPTPYIHQGNWQAQVSLSWTIFDARRRRYRIIEAEARKRVAQQELNSLRDLATNEVWSSYISSKVAFRRLDTSKVLLNAAQTSYDAALASFDRGLATYVDVVTAEQALAQARNEQVQAETQVMTDLAQLAYRTGDLLGSRFLKANRNAK
ncbi:MAG TPA: TolC family protein [Bryobacteraceae bacterium]|nr:TolC family protein [Bryobacteraceae bacterium]